MEKVSSPEFVERATDQRIEHVAAVLREHNVEVLIVEDGEEARKKVLELIPDGAEVHYGRSKTLEDIGLTTVLNSDKYDAVRPKYMKLDRQTQWREIRKLASAPDYMVGSVQAVTDKGELVVASATGGQITPYAAGAGRVILVVGSQKIVKDLDEALRRIREHVFPYEDARLRQETNGVGTQLLRVLIMYGERTPGRTTLILVRSPLGV